MAGFIDNETKKRRQEYIEERERRRKAVVDAEVSAFLESIDDICQDVAKEVKLRYVYDGKPPSLVNIICYQATTALLRIARSVLRNSYALFSKGKSASAQSLSGRSNPRSTMIVGNPV